MGSAGPRTPTRRLLTNYKKSLTICEELLRQDSSNAKRQRAVAINLMKIGDASDPHQPETISALRKGVVILESLAAADPDNARARREVGWGYYQTGRYSDGRGRLYRRGREPPKIARDSREIRGGRSAKCPGEFRSCQHARRSCGRPLRHGRLGAAVAQARQGIAIVTALLSADPTNAIYSRNLAGFIDQLGDVYARSGADKDTAVTERIRAWSEARNSYEKAHEIFSDLQKHGTLPSADAAEQPKEFARRMSNCEEALKQLAAAHNTR